MSARRGALRAPLFIAAVLVVVAVTRGCENGGGGNEPSDPVSVKVTHVVDGDTIDVALPDGGEETVRYIGIDTPETVKPDTPVQCGGPEAHDANESFGGMVRVRARPRRTSSALTNSDCGFGPPPRGSGFGPPPRSFSRAPRGR